MAMKWKTPVIIEIAVGLEINAYASVHARIFRYYHGRWRKHSGDPHRAGHAQSG
jgi:coenzyme PQQ precursor peptide PqqA